MNFKWFFTSGARASSVSDTACFVMWLFYMTAAASARNGFKEVEVCDESNLSLNCPRHQVILVTHATYGRMSLNDCVNDDFGFIGCKNDVTHVLHQRCTGRHNCEFQVLRKAFPETPSCHTDLKGYVRVRYKCVQVQSVDDSGCGQLTHLSGYLSSIVADTSGCGSMVSPWILQGQPGQVVSVDTGNGSYMDQCVTVKESGMSTQRSVCGKYMSSGHQLSLWFKRNTHVIVTYKISGCADPDDPVGGSVERTGLQAYFQCTVNADVGWSLTCNGTHWVGTSLNCSMAELSAPDVETELIFLPLGVIVVIVLALAVVIGLFILIVGLYLMKRKHVLSSTGNEGTIMLQNQKPVPTYDVYNKPSNWEYGRCMVHGNTEYEYGTVYCGHRDYIQSPDVVQQEKQPLNSNTECPPEDPRTITLLTQRTQSNPENISACSTPILTQKEARTEAVLSKELNTTRKGILTKITSPPGCDMCNEADSVILHTFKPALPQL